MVSVTAAISSSKLATLASSPVLTSVRPALSVEVQVIVVTSTAMISAATTAISPEVGSWLILRDKNCAFVTTTLQEVMAREYRFFDLSSSALILSCAASVRALFSFSFVMAREYRFFDLLSSA